MEDTRGAWGTIVLTAVPAAIWGSTYAVTQLWLPPDRPLFAGVVRALPVGLLMMLWLRRLPTGSWWWRSFVLGGLNIGFFYALLFVAAYRLPSGLGSTAVALSPLLVAAVAWLVLGQRPLLVTVLSGVGGLVGVSLLAVAGGVDGDLDPVGVAAAVGAVTVTAFGFVLTKRWSPPQDVIVVTSWQLVAAGLILLPLAIVVEGAPPAIDLPAAAAYVYLGVVGSGLAYVLWFRGIARLGPTTASVIGLVNPAVGVLLGVLLLGERIGPLQVVGLVVILASVVLGQEPVRVALRSHRPFGGSRPAQTGPSAPAAPPALESASPMASRAPASSTALSR